MDPKQTYNVVVNTNDDPWEGDFYDGLCAPMDEYDDDRYDTQSTWVDIIDAIWEGRTVEHVVYSELEHTLGARLTILRVV